MTKERKGSHVERVARRTVADEEVRRLAIERLHFFETELEKMGLRFRTGAELEFFLENEKGAHTAMSSAQMRKVRAAFIESPYVEQVVNESSLPVSPLTGHKLFAAITLANYGLFGNSFGGGMEEFLFGQSVALAADIPWMVVRDVLTQKTEIILGEGMGIKDKDFKPERLYPATMSRAVEAVKTALERHQHDVNEKGKRLWKGEAVAFDAIRKDMRVLGLKKTVSAGLHMSVSVQNSEGKNLFIGKGGQPSDLMKHCVESLLHVQREGAHLMLPDENSYARLVSKGKPHAITADMTARTSPIHIKQLVIAHFANITARITHGFSDRPVSSKRTRIENRMPGADADPYLSMVATAGAMYHAIKQHVQMAQDGKGGISVDAFEGKMPEYVMPANSKEAYKALQKSDMMRDIMGDALYEAVLARDKQKIKGVAI